MVQTYDACKRFQSTLPVGGATLLKAALGYKTKISIHAPRGGSDVKVTVFVRIHDDFNPRSPWGERLRSKMAASLINKISIHAPRGGSDRKEVTIFAYL